MKLSQIVSLLCFAAITASDSWITEGTDPAYPRELYFVGVGMSERGLSEAKTSAVVEVRKQITVKVNASLLDVQTSETRNGVEKTGAEVQSRAHLRTRGDIQGVEIAKTGENSGIFYALAVLDKQKFASNCRAVIHEKKQLLESKMTSATSALDRGEIGPMLKELAVARAALAQLHEQRSLLSAAAEITEKEQTTYSRDDIDNLAERSIAGLSLVKVSGDKQIVSAGASPEKPFVLKANAGDSPAPMLPVNLLDESGRILKTGYADNEGLIEFLLEEAASTQTGRHLCRATIGIELSGDKADILSGKEQIFSYTVEADAAHVRVSLVLPEALKSEEPLLKKKVVHCLANYNINDFAGACHELTVDVSAQETARIQGVSAARSMVKSDANVTFTLMDSQGKRLLSFAAAGKGTGSTLGKSVATALSQLRIKHKAVELSSAVAKDPKTNCAGTSVPGKASSAVEQQTVTAKTEPTTTPAPPPSGDGSNPEKAVFLPADNEWRKSTYIDAAKWFVFEAGANETYRLYLDNASNNKSSAYSAVRTLVTVYRDNLLDKLGTSGRVSHYLTDPYRINTPTAEKVYLKVEGFGNEMNETFGIRLTQARR